MVTAAAATVSWWARPAAAERMHLRLVKSEPVKDSTVTSPSHVRLWFSLKPAMSVTVIRLTSAQDAAIKLGKPTFSGDVKTPVEVSIDEPLAPGKYTVSWKTASSDMHPISGDFSFTVK
jgi:methionine-rich copper-binding protein CopC